MSPKVLREVTVDFHVEAKGWERTFGVTIRLPTRSRWTEMTTASLERKETSEAVEKAEAMEREKAFLEEVVTGWDDRLTDEDGAPIPFNSENLAFFFYEHFWLVEQFWKNLADAVLGTHEKNLET